MALVALLQEGDIERENLYFNHVLSFQNWCSTSSLEINVLKTKELVLQNNKNIMKPVIVHGQTVEMVDDFKYLGTYIDSSLTFQINTDHIFKKCSQRLHLLRKLNNFGVSQTILETVYKSQVESILSFNMIMWYGNLNIKWRNKLQKIVNMASKILGKPQKQLSSLYNELIRSKAEKIISDSSHPLYSEFELLPSGKRYRLPMARKNLYKKSFVPEAVNTINKTRMR